MHTTMLNCLLFNKQGCSLKGIYKRRTEVWYFFLLTFSIAVPVNWYSYNFNFSCYYVNNLCRIISNRKYKTLKCLSIIRILNVDKSWNIFYIYLLEKYKMYVLTLFPAGLLDLQQNYFSFRNIVMVTAWYTTKFHGSINKINYVVRIIRTIHRIWKKGSQPFTPPIK